MTRTEILGARGELEDLKAMLATLAALPGEVVVMRAAAVMGREHLLSAISHARRAFSRGGNSARTLGVEVLLYLSGERQISHALSQCGVAPGEKDFVILAIDSDGEAALAKLGWKRDDSLLDLDEEKESRLQAEFPHLALPSQGLALEKVAMLEIIK